MINLYRERSSIPAAEDRGGKKAQRRRTPKASGEGDSTSSEFGEGEGEWEEEERKWEGVMGMGYLRDIVQVCVLCLVGYLMVRGIQAWRLSSPTEDRQGTVVADPHKRMIEKLLNPNEIQDVPRALEAAEKLLQSAGNSVHVIISLQKDLQHSNQLLHSHVPQFVQCIHMTLSRTHIEAEARMNGSGKETGGGAKAGEEGIFKSANRFHLVLFSDNVLAAGVVINSTLRNTKSPSEFVFHIVTDASVYPAMTEWMGARFIESGQAAVEVMSLQDHEWIASTFAEHRTIDRTSIFQHVQFYLPRLFPDLDKILFLHDDVVVTADLAPLWQVPMKDAVLLAVQDCSRLPRQQFLHVFNFSDPIIADQFDPKTCAPTEGMSIFNLKKWREGRYTEVYHDWQKQNAGETLWSRVHFPVSSIVFYGETAALPWKWHFSGLGEDWGSEFPVLGSELPAILHFTGRSKPWVERTEMAEFWWQYFFVDKGLMKSCELWQGSFF